MPDETVTTLGIDFGTTNTVLAITDGQAGAVVLRYDGPTETVSVFRSALSFQSHSESGSTRTERRIEAGPWAIDAYLEDPLDTRFIQSFKTFAASAAFTETVIDNRRYRFEDLLSAFLLRIRHHAGDSLAVLPTRVIIGRPVTFAGGAPNEALALERYQTAFSRLGVTDIRYAYEPVGAAFFFARTLSTDATVLVADFGGGTSDFSIVRFEPGEQGLRSTPLGRSGVGVAGDSFDYRIIDQLVSPELGKGGHYRALDKVLPIPQRYFAAFARWDQLTLLRASKDMRDIRALARSALDPEKIERMIEVLDDNHGYALYQAVSQLKIDLSTQETATFSFVAGSIRIERSVSRSQFESWIAAELKTMADALERAMAASGLEDAEINRVFLTGGTSYVPAVRSIFQRRFSKAKIETGTEFNSIALGLALIGSEADLDLWSQRPTI